MILFILTKDKKKKLKDFEFDTIDTF